MNQAIEVVLRASGGYLTLFDGSLREHALVQALPARGGAVVASASELLLHAHAELVPLRLRIQAGSTEDEVPVDPEPASAGADGDGFSTVLEATLELPTGKLLLDTSAGAQLSLKDFSAPTGTCQVRVLTRGGPAAVRIEDAYLDMDTDELIEQVGPEEWTVHLYQ